MAYSDKDWEEIRIMFEQGRSLGYIASNSRIKDKGTISRKAKKEGWEKGKTQPLIDKDVQARQALAEVEAEKSNLSATELRSHEQAVSERLKLETFFRNASVLVAKTVTSKLQKESADASFQDLNAASSALTKAQENVLGKQPETVINNANTMQTAIAIDRSPERVKEIREMLDAAIGRR